MKGNTIFMQNFSCFLYKIFICIFFIFSTIPSYSQCGPPAAANCQGIPASELIRSTPGNEIFTFDSFSKYNGGITISGSTLLRLRVLANNASCKWILRMYIDNDGGATPLNEWETITPYGTSGTIPTLDLIQVKIYNTCGTPINSGIYQNFAPLTGSSIDIINDVALIPAGSCLPNVNGAGSYLSNYDEYSFTIDYKIVPGLTHAPGMYQMILKFCLVEAL